MLPIPACSNATPSRRVVTSTLYVAEGLASVIVLPHAQESIEHGLRGSKRQATELMT